MTVGMNLRWWNEAVAELERFQATAAAPAGQPIGGGRGTFDLIDGDGGDNVLPGTSNADTIRGFGGNDYEYGYGGADTMYGGDGNDNLYGGLDFDTINGGAGDDVIKGTEFGAILSTGGPCDVISGGTGVDTLMIDYGSWVNSGTGQPVGVVLDFSTGGGQVQVDGFQGESFSQMERLNFVGPEGNDTITGGKDNDSIDGRGGNDIINAGKGDDLVRDTWGTVSADGGDGTDAISFYGLSFGHEYGDTTINANAGTINAGATQGTFHNFESLIIYTGNGTDTITGFNSGQNFMYGGGSGAKTFTGGALNDTLYGGNGDDTIYGGNGDDILGPGFTGHDMVYGGGGNDTYYGGGSTGWVYGGGGDDSLNGAGNGASFDCGGGDDLIFIYEPTPSIGTQSFLGGTGYDVLRVYWQNASLDFSASTIDMEELQWVDYGHACNLTTSFTTAQLLDFDVVRLGTQNRDDDFFRIVLTDNAPVVLQEISQYMELQLADGGQSVDMSGVGTDWVPYVVGGNGDDTVIAPVFAAVDFFKAELMAGNDAFTGSNIRDEVFGGDGNDTINGGGGNDVVHHTDDVLYGDGGDDTIDGGKRNDKLFGGDGKDFLIGGLGDDALSGGRDADKLNGGDGLDTFVYKSAKESHGKHFDTVVGADFSAQDRFDTKNPVTGVDNTIATGTLSKATFDADLAAAADAAHLSAGHAVVFTPDTGGFAGTTFLIIDGNGTAGYQAGDDLVVLLRNTVNIATLDAADFS